MSGERRDGRVVEQDVYWELDLSSGAQAMDDPRLTGTGIIVTEESALAAGDTVTIEIEKIGQLTNPVTDEA